MIRMVHGAALALVLLVGARAAHATEPPPAVPTQAAPSDPGSERMICKTRQATGSRLGAKRICKTRQQWDDASREDRKALQDHLTRGSQITPMQ